MKKTILALLLALCCCLTAFPVLAEDVQPAVVNAVITMESGDEIRLELYPDVAPVTVRNFVELAQSGFYDGLIFHRVIENFMIQGGCPNGDGYGDPGYGIEGEFAANGFVNELKHERGVISMARSYDLDSAGSQFFIMHADAPSLDGLYAAFGRVTDEESMAVVDAIATTETGAEDKPVTDQRIKTVTVDTHGLDLTPPERILPTVTIVMEGGQEIHLELYPEIAPNTAANFIALAEEGFYDGLIFHRVIENFMIQGGSPRGDGAGGPGYAIKGEFAANGFDNPISHRRGVISMARTSEPDSAGSQFFIVHADSTHLDGLYAAFGKVTDEASMAVVDEIATSATDDYDKPEEGWRIETIIVETHGVTYTPEIIEYAF